MSTAVIVSEDDAIHQPRNTKVLQLFGKAEANFWYLGSLETMETVRYVFCSHWDMASFI